MTTAPTSGHINPPRPNGYKPPLVGSAVQLRNFVWGGLCLVGGALILTDVLPASQEFATGPRIGLALALWTMALLWLGAPFTAWFLRKTTRPEDYQGSCPVGKVCPSCEAFNYNPRSTCRICATELASTPQATR